MAEVTALNGRITDAVAQATDLGVAAGPAVAAGALQFAAAQTGALLLQNATASQQALQQTAAAVLAGAVASLRDPPVRKPAVRKTGAAG